MTEQRAREACGDNLVIEVMKDKLGMWVCKCGTKNIDPLKESCDLEVTQFGSKKTVVKL